MLLSLSISQYMMYDLCMIYNMMYDVMILQYFNYVILQYFNILPLFDLNRHITCNAQLSQGCSPTSTAIFSPIPSP